MASEDYSDDNTDYKDLGRGISLKFIRDIDLKLDLLVNQNPDFIFVITIVIAIVCFIVLLGIFIQSACVRNHS